MELITPDILKRIVERSGETDSVDRLLSAKCEDVVGNGENYCSDIVRVRLKAELTSGKLFSKTVVLKIFLKDLEENAHKEMKAYFANEVVMYEKILVRLVKLAEQHNMGRIWSNCYFANTDLLILDDLTEEGFLVAPRHNGLTLDDGLRVIKYIGKLHALSVAAERRKLIDPDLIRTLYTWTELDNFQARLVRNSMRVVGDIVMQWGNEWEDAGRRIKDYSNRISEKLNSLFKEEVKLKVVNHGDAWINNLMIRYDKNRHVESLRFVDFQNATYNSCAWDLVYYLYSSLQGDVMRANYDRLLTSYREEFVDTLLRLGEDPTLAPTMDEIKADIVRLHPFCLTVACTVMGVVFNVSKQPMQIDDLLSNDFKLRNVFASDTWQSTVKVHIKYFQKHKLF